MRSSRDRFGPLGLIVSLALFACALIIGAPGAQAEGADMGPPAFELALVTFPAELVPVLGMNVSEPIEGLHVYFAELRVEIPSAQDTVEHARCESGRGPSGVDRRPPVIDLKRDEWTFAPGSTLHPLRC